MAIKTAPDLNAAIDGMSAQELRSLIDQAESKLREKMQGAKQALIDEMREKAQQLGLSFEDLVQPSSTAKKQGGKRGAAPIKYRGPNGETWSARGRTPHWMQALEAAGHSREDFAVARNEAQPE